MKIDLDWIQKELDAGRDVELECISSSKLTSGGFATEWEKTLDRDELIVDYIHEDGEIVLRGQMVGLSFPPAIPENSFKYFRIKNPAPTFIALIDVAVKACKDDKIYFRFLSSDQISFTVNNTEEGKINIMKQSCGQEELKEAIELINSLYTETFVIESRTDIVRAIDEAEITLINGVCGRFVKEYDDGARVRMLVDGESYKLPFFVLQGATVTQNKARKEIL